MKTKEIGFGLGVLGIGMWLGGLGQGLRAASPVLDDVTDNAEVGEPTVVWYGLTPLSERPGRHYLYRAWSDGRVEGRLIDGSEEWFSCVDDSPCVGPWVSIEPRDQHDQIRLGPEGPRRQAPVATPHSQRVVEMPPPLSETELASMTPNEVKARLAWVAGARATPGLSEEEVKRLRTEFDLLMKAVRKGGPTPRD